MSIKKNYNPGEGLAAADWNKAATKIDTFDSNNFIDVPKGFNLVKEGIVISKGGTEYKMNHVESPMVFFDYKIGKYKMVFTAYNSGFVGSHGYAISDDLENWIEMGQFFTASGVNGAPDEGGTTGPFIWLEGDTYYLFYIGLTEVGYESGTVSMCLATSTDFTTWTRHGSIIAPGTSQPTWRKGQVFHPNIVKKGVTYYLFFNADDTVGNEKIGYATSYDLLTWTVDDINSPIVLNSAPTHDWEYFFVGDPCVYKLGNTWFMAYFAIGWGTGGCDGLAYTTDADFPLNWKKYPGNPILTSSEVYDNEYAHKPFIFITQNKYYHWYTAVGTNTGRQIALASESRLSKSILFPINGLLASWDFEEQTGDYKDISGNGKNLVRSGSVTTVYGKKSKAAKFTRSLSQHLVANSNSGLSASSKGLTICFWARLTAQGVGTYQTFVNKGDATNTEYAIYFQQTDATQDGDGGIAFKVTLDGFTNHFVGAQFIADGRWQFVQAVYDGINISMKVDNNDAQFTALTGNLYASNTLPLWIGGANGDTGVYVEGAIDKLMICNEAVPQSQLNYLYNYGK